MANKLKLGLVLTVAGIAGIVNAASDIKSVSLAKTSSGGYQVVVQGTGLTKPRVFRTSQNTAFIVEFDGNLRTSKGKIDVNSAGIKYVQYGWFSARPPRVRVMLKVDPSVDPKVVQRGADWSIEVTGPVQASTATTRATAAVKAGPATKDADGLLIPKLPYPTDALPIPGEGQKVEIHHTAPLNVLAPAKTNVQPTGGSQTAPALPKVESTTVTATQNALPKPAPAAPMVSLDFVGTDIIQILKALSIQSSVNIVASPEVSPADKPTKLTVSLHGVSLDDALSYVTAISGMRYGRVGNTFIVTTVENFSEAMRAVMERSGSKYVTRVISLKSGEASKIREATIHALPQTGNNGFYEIIVPIGNQVPTATTTPASAKGEGEGQKQPDPGAKPVPSGRSYYLMIVAGEDRAAGLEAYIRKLDEEIINSSSLTSRTGISTVVIPIQSGETGRVKTMIDRLIADHPRASEFSITESIMEGAVKGEAQTMTLMMIGPLDDIAKLKEFAMTLDKELCAVIGKYYSTDRTGLAKEWEVVDVMFVEPTLLELDLRSRFKGLQVSLLPDAVTPNVKGSTTSTTTNQGSTGSGSGGAGAAADGGQSSSTQTQTDQHTVTGREPMRLMLRGNRGDIEAAKEYIALVDVAPRQIALELRVMELTKEEALRIGIDWNAIISGNLTHIRINQGLGDKPDTQGTFGAGDNINQPQDSNWFLATLDSLNSGRNIIARPNALVSDGRSTKLFVGDTVRYIKSIQSTQNGTTVETSEVQVGVVFNIAARLGGNGQIAMNLDQNFSILTGFTPVPGGGNLPQTSDRITNMFVNMESGETVAVGGLTLDQDRKSLNGIPILKDIPILGRLFSREDTKKVRTEIVFFLTARTVDRTNRSNAPRPASQLMGNDGREVAKPKRGPKGG